VWSSTSSPDGNREPEHWAGAIVNVGGGRGCSLSLLEATEICRELTGREVPIGADRDPRPGDVRIYLSDCRTPFERTTWRPARGARDTLAAIHAWIREAEPDLVRVLGPGSRTM
jgi:CDP-paratose 2-epimerase